MDTPVVTPGQSGAEKPPASRTEPQSAISQAGERLDLALLTCQEGRFWLYERDGVNSVIVEDRTAFEVVHSGRPYLGHTHPWIWVIDVDVDTRVGEGAQALQELLAALEAAGCEELFVCRSGQPGRVHVYVYEPEGLEWRQAFRERTHPAKGITDRTQKGGCPIRPPGAPHRFGGSSEPEEPVEDVLETLREWADRHDHLVAPRTTLPAPVAEHGTIADLSRRDQAMLRSDWDLADQLGPPVPRTTADAVDRSYVEFQLARAFQHAGLTLEQFLSIRRPGGVFPSAKAGERGTGAERYLRTQWNAGARRPGGSSRGGLSRLDDFEAMLIGRNLVRLAGREQLVLSALIECARSRRLTTFGCSQRELREITAGLGWSGIQQALDLLVEHGVITIARNDDGEAGTITLRVAATLEGLEPLHLTDTLQSDDATNFVLPDPLHPAWGRDALGYNGRSVLACFSPSEPRRQAEAMRHGGPSSKDTFRKYRDWLIEIGALVATDVNRRPRYVIDPDFDWDAWAEREGHTRAMTVRRARLVLSHAAEQLEHHSWLRSLGKITALEHVKRTATIKQRSERARSELDSLSRVDVDGVGLVNLSTGEILARRPLPLSSHCRACGGPTAAVNSETGLPLHESCLMPPWVARIERQQGAEIPDHLVRPLPPADWGEFGPPTNLKEFPAMNRPTYDLKAVA